MCWGREETRSCMHGVQGEKLTTASERCARGCGAAVAQTGRILYLRHLAVQAVPSISMELTFHITGVVLFPLVRVCLLLDAHSGSTSLSYGYPLQPRAHKAPTTSTDQNHVIFSSTYFPFSHYLFPSSHPNEALVLKHSFFTQKKGRWANCTGTEAEHSQICSFSAQQMGK